MIRGVSLVRTGSSRLDATTPPEVGTCFRPKVCDRDVPRLQETDPVVYTIALRTDLHPQLDEQRRFCWRENDHFYESYPEE